MRALLVTLLVFLVAVQSVLAAVSGLNKDGSLDRAKISKAYFEGDFDMVVEALETFRKLQPDPTREDKIYVYKYLSVIYAAKPETRGKAESYMYQLLKIMPSIELMDLYISDNIESIFNNVRVRFEHQQRIGLDSGQGSKSAPAAANAAPVSPKPAASVAADEKPAAASPHSGKDGKEGKDGKWMWWTGAAAVGVAAAVAGFVILSDSPNMVAQAADTLDLE